VERFPEILRDHLQRPRNVGEPEGGADLRGEARNAACGDIVVLFLRLDRAPGSPPLIAAAGFLAQGCPAAMAMASASCELLPGLAADAALPEALAARLTAHVGAPRPAHRHALA